MASDSTRAEGFVVETMRLADVLTSRGFALFLLALSVAVLFVWTRYPSFYSHWLMLVPGVLLLSMSLCVIRRLGGGLKDGAFAGSVVFHLGMMVVILTGLMSPLWRYYAVAVLPQDVMVEPTDQNFFAQTRGPFSPTPGFVYLRLNHHKTIYQDGRFPVEHRADITVGYMEGDSFVSKDETVRVNDPVKVDGFQIMLARGYMSPRFVLLDERGRILFDGFVKLSNRTAVEDTFEIPEAGLVFYTRFFPDMFKKGASYGTLSLEPRNPAFGIKVAKKDDLFRDMWRGVLSPQDVAHFNGFTMELKEMRQVVELQISSDPSLWGIVAGWVLVVAGLFLRYFYIL